jgi:hypothetical protein
MPMARVCRVMPLLQRREATWYFRFKLPVTLRRLAGRSELRLSLGTGELAVARERAERVFPDVYLLKQLARHMSALEPLHVQKALAPRLRCSHCGKNAAEVVAVAKPRPRGVPKNPH